MENKLKNMREVGRSEIILSPELPVYDCNGEKVDVRLSYDGVLQHHIIYAQLNGELGFDKIDYIECDNQWYHEGFLSLNYFKLYRHDYIPSVIGDWNSGLILKYKDNVDKLVEAFAGKHKIDLTNAAHCWVDGDFGGVYDFIEYTIPFKDIIRDLELNLPPNIYDKYRDAVMLDETAEDYIDWFFQNENK